MEVTVFLGLPSGMCGRRGEIREGSEIQNCRIFEKVIGKKFFESSFVNSWISVQHARPFPTGRAADRFAHSAGAFRESRGEKCQLSIWKNAVYLFSPRYFRNYSLLFFAARLSILQFTRIRGATFEITFYEFRNCNLLLFVALLSKLQFTHFRWATCDIAVDSFSRRQFRN